MRGLTTLTFWTPAATQYFAQLCMPSMTMLTAPYKHIGSARAVGGEALAAFREGASAL